MPTVKINLSNKVITLKYEELDDLDMDDLLKIDYSNIVGEMLTFSVIMNKIGIIRSEANNRLRDKRLDIDVYRAQTAESYRRSFTRMSTASAGSSRLAKPTKDEVDNAVTLDSGMQEKLKELSKLEMSCEMLEALYWACKSKDSKLDAFGKSFSPEDFDQELVESKLNGILIKGFNKPFQNNNHGTTKSK